MFKRILLNTSYFILALISVLVLGGVIVAHAKGITQISQSINEHHLFWMIWRYSLMLIFIAFYPKIVRFGIKNRKGLSEMVVNHYSHRGYAIFICLFYELIIVRNAFSWVVGKLLH